MVLPFDRDRSFRAAWILVLLGVTLLNGGCQGLPAPRWHSSTVVDTAITVEQEVEERPAPPKADPAGPRRRPPTSLVRLIALDEAAPDPPFRSSFAPVKKSEGRKSRFDRSIQANESAPVLVRSSLKVAIAEPDDTADHGVAAFDGETDGADAGEGLGEDRSLFDPPDDSGDDEECCVYSLRDDVRDLFPMLYNDTLACITWPNAIILGIAAGGAVAIRENLDGQVRDYTADHQPRWGGATSVLRQFGEFTYQLPVIGAIYGLGLWTQDEHTHEFSKTLISAYSITAITTVIIKGATDTNRPTDEFQNGDYGFPSYHTASGFAIAAVVDEYYGWPVGIPCYVLAGLVGWTRIDQREHDLSDVVFGSVLGFVIGKSISAAHMDGITGCQVVPCYDPATRSFGAVYHKKFRGTARREDVAGFAGARTRVRRRFRRSSLRPSRRSAG